MIAARFRLPTDQPHKETVRMTSRRATRRLALIICSALVVSLGVAANAWAASAPHWQIVTIAAPTYFHAGDSLDFYEVRANNDGSAPSTGPVTLVDHLPPGVVITSALGVSGQAGFGYNNEPEIPCTITGQTVECTAVESVPISSRVAMKINVEVPPGTTGPLENTATIVGGGAPEEATTTISTPVVPPSTPVPWGAKLSVEATSGEGTVAKQAGSHPYSLTTVLANNVGAVAPGEHCGPAGNFVASPGCAVIVGAPKDVEVDLPPGLVGNPQGIPECTQEEFQNAVANGGCPADTQVGSAFLAFYSSGTAEQFAPIYNVEPPPGQPAEFGFIVGGQAKVAMFFHVRSDGDYGLTAKLSEITQFDIVRLAELTIWGVPAAKSHDEMRNSVNVCEPFGCEAGTPPVALLSMPTSCSAGSLPVALRTDPWLAPGQFAIGGPPAAITAMGGCSRVPFDPTLELQPTTTVADSPTGLHVDLHVPQPKPTGAETEDQVAASLVRANLRDAVVTLPKGLTVNPSSANGLAGCQPEQVKLHGDEPATCPDAAKIGTVEIDTPLLDHPLPGAVYLASPYENPFGTLLAIYVAVYDPQSGIVIKLAGKVEIGAEGQLTTSFAQNPQLPFEDFKLDFFGGPRAALKTPALCGSYSTTSSLTPWSAPESGAPATPSNAYEVGAQPGGGSCPTSFAQQPSRPAFEAGSESPLAGAYAPFVVRLRREDGTQQFSSLTVTPPPGLLGKLAGIPYCPDADLAVAAGKSGKEEQAAPSCPSASEVGIVNVGAGAGPSPFFVQGRAYLTGPYRGAPLSLAIITPAVAGPFDLGTVVVRSALEVDPFTSQITVKSDPIPTELKGIPLDVRSIAVKMSRSGFTLNPTNCESLAADGSVTTTVGQTTALHNGFQVGNCKALKFKPTLKLSLSGSTKHTGHPALKAVVTYPKQGRYANIARAQVNLPRSEFLDQSNLNKTCTKPVLLEGKCPKTAVYGKVKAWTPLLDKPLSGNVYLVGGFGYKLPALIAELNGQIRVLLKGKVDSGPNKGIRTTFELVPDAPVSRFVLEMRGGPKYSLLENSEPLCKKPQRAIAQFRAQNGLVMQSKPLIANDCKTGKPKKHKHGKGRGH